MPQVTRHHTVQSCHDHAKVLRHALVQRDQKVDQHGGHGAQGQHAKKSWFGAIIQSYLPQHKQQRQCRHNLDQHTLGCKRQAAHRATPRSPRFEKLDARLPVPSLLRQQTNSPYHICKMTPPCQNDLYEIQSRVMGTTTGNLKPSDCKRITYLWSLSQTNVER